MFLNAIIIERQLEADDGFITSSCFVNKLIKHWLLLHIFLDSWPYFSLTLQSKKSW